MTRVRWGVGMARQIYESEQDRINEQRLADVIRGAYNCELHKMPMKLSLDFMATRGGEAVAFFEMRQRRNLMAAYPTYMISMYKVMMADALAKSTGLPSFLAVQWSDRAGMCRLPSEGSSYGVGGSVRRGDPQDIEPVAYIPMEKFKVIA